MCVGIRVTRQGGVFAGGRKVGVKGQLSGGALVEHGRGSALPCQS